MDELTRDIIKLAPEFGITLKEDSNDVEGEVADKLKRAAKIDEVDTITFGLETDDGKIVKVFVKAEDAEKFEKLMADLLGEEDSIEDALNRVANEVDIVDVEWPEEEEDGDADETDDDLEDDGGDVLNKKVYDKANLNKEIDSGTKPAIESLSFGERFTAKLNEASPASYVGTRMRTPSQQLVYQAVLDLGIPEMVLDRSPYRAQIVKGLKNMAIELQQNGSMKNALKLFVKRAIAGLEKEAEEERAKARKKQKDKFGSSKDEETPVDEAVVMESVSGELFWGVLEKLFVVVDGGGAIATHAKNLMELPAYKALVTRSQTVLQSKVQGQLMTKLQQLQRALGTSSPSVAEALSPADIQSFIVKMVQLADANENKSAADRVLKTTQMKALLNRVKATAGSLPSMVKSKIADISKLLGGSPVVEAEEEVDLQGMHQQKIDVVKWTVKSIDGGVSLEAEDGSIEYSIVDEDMERMMKALSNRESITIKATDGSKLVISPRGRAAVIKVIGSQTRIELNAPDVDAVIDAAAVMAEAKRISEGKDPRVPKDEEWELYSSNTASKQAAKRLSDTLRKKLSDVLNMNLTDEDDRMKQAKRIRDEMYKEMSKYTKLGARDTEPESHLVDCIERELSLTKYSLER